MLITEHQLSTLNYSSTPAGKENNFSTPGSTPKVKHKNLKG